MLENHCQPCGDQGVAVSCDVAVWVDTSNQAIKGLWLWLR